ncbi:hypothetical protein IU462_30075, partial [Nocardia farcinica]|uniref:phosphopantothenoylcysteine decarboxylase domain-containing protein n=1 Tax=Nocardia farcinica TaxID=37329 RepID=UPI0027D2CBEE
MGGDAGPGRLVEPEAALEVIRDVLACLPSAGGGFRAGPAQDLVGTHVLVTAGGTREPVDPVRYLGNRSSGRLGFALAAAARDRGAGGAAPSGRGRGSRTRCRVWRASARGAPARSVCSQGRSMSVRP